MTRTPIALILLFLCPGFLWANTPDEGLNTALKQRISLQQKRAPGQPLKVFNNFSLGGAIGPSWFMGDLADHKVFPKPADWGTTLGYNWSLFVRKEFKYGIGVKLQYDKGDLQGGRVIGDASPRVNFETDYQAIHLQLSYNLLDAVFSERKQLRYYLIGEIGVGMTFYRSVTTWGEGPPLVRDFEGYTSPDEPETQRYANLERAPMARTWNVPVGLTFGYMLNHRVDVNAQVMLNNVFTDRLETWARDNSAQDKYAFVTVGVRYNFNRTEDDMPERKKRKTKKRNRDDVSPNELDLGKKLKPVKGFKVNKKREEELMKAMTRMYELQLRLFELQYMMR